MFKLYLYFNSFRCYWTFLTRIIYTYINGTFISLYNTCIVFFFCTFCEDLILSTKNRWNSMIFKCKRCPLIFLKSNSRKCLLHILLYFVRTNPFICIASVHCFVICLFTKGKLNTKNNVYILFEHAFFKMILTKKYEYHYL